MAVGLWPALIERIAHVRGPVPGFSIRGAWPYGTSRARGGGLWPALIKRVAHVRGPVPGFSIRGAWPHGTSRARGGGLWPALIERIAHVRGPVPGFSIRAYGSSLSLVLIKRYSARARGVVGRGLEGLSHWGVWLGAVHLDWSKSPRWMGARRCAGVPCQAGRGGNRSGPNCFLVSFAQKLDAKNTGIPVKQRERHFAVILVG